MIQTNETALIGKLKTCMHAQMWNSCCFGWNLELQHYVNLGLITNLDRRCCSFFAAAMQKKNTNDRDLILIRLYEYFCLTHFNRKGTKMPKNNLLTWCGCFKHSYHHLFFGKTNQAFCSFQFERCMCANQNSHLPHENKLVG